MSTNDTSQSNEGTHDAPSDVNEVDDISLVRAAQNGDLGAFDMLVKAHRGKIYAMIYNMLNNQADALDLTQEAFIKAWKALPKFEARSKFSTWLYRISHNVVYDHMRKRKITSAGEFNDEILADSTIEPTARTTPREATAPDKKMENNELANTIKAAMAKLSPEHREVILLREVDGYDYKEIAELTQSSLGTVMSRLYYARKKLQSLLQNVR